LLVSNLVLKSKFHTFTVSLAFDTIKIADSSWDREDIPAEQREEFIYGLEQACRDKQAEALACSILIASIARLIAEI
jgi:hypothetical protein